MSHPEVNVEAVVEFDAAVHSGRLELELAFEAGLVDLLHLLFQSLGGNPRLQVDEAVVRHYLALLGRPRALRSAV